MCRCKSRSFSDHWCLMILEGFTWRSWSRRRVSPPVWSTLSPGTGPPPAPPSSTIQMLTRWVYSRALRGKRLIERGLRNHEHATGTEREEESKLPHLILFGENKSRQQLAITMRCSRRKAARLLSTTRPDPPPPPVNTEIITTLSLF